MFAEFFLSFVVLAIAFAGLATVVTEIATKDSSIFREILTDTRRLATTDATRRAAPAEGNAVPPHGRPAGA